ncbi:chromosome condensation regulator RCC1 [Psychrobacter sp. 16-MNA-CIBAN-0192]|uniref:chromosome condensation regulator RCC1 n=1 Tax=Psychrobacter sp. 16-MNA-CIBAN-0192 TaxID=3140448 RepID=UPI00331ECB04
MRLSRLSQALIFTSAALMLSACGNDADSNTTVHDVTPPLVTTDSNFANGYSAVAALFLSGTVQDNGGIKSMTYQLNQALAQPLNLNKDGAFYDSILLAAGSNAVTLTATDNAGNVMRMTKTLYVGNTVAAGNSHTGALQSSKLYGFGGNNFGQTGLGMTSKIADSIGHPDTPMLMHSAPRNLVAIDFNQNHSLAIAQDGRVYSWGEDKFGQLGRGDTGRNDCTNSKNDCRLDISAIAGIDHAVMLAAGYSHNLVLTADGSVWAFGANGQGQLGNANLTNAKSSTPVKVDFSAAQGIGRIIQVVASANSSYALDDKGQVWGWGSDAYANLGRGQACNKVNNCANFNAVPVLINVIPATTSNNDSSNTATNKTVDNPNNIEQITQLAAGRDHILALTNKETVYGWG